MTNYEIIVLKIQFSNPLLHHVEFAKGDHHENKDNTKTSRKKFDVTINSTVTLIIKTKKQRNIQLFNNMKWENNNSFYWF